MLFLFPGSLRQKNTSDLKFQPLVKTGDKTGTVNFDDIMEQSFFGQGQLNPARRQLQTGDEYIMAAHIRGKAPPAPQLPPDHPPLSSGESLVRKPADVRRRLAAVGCRPKRLRLRPKTETETEPLRPAAAEPRPRQKLKPAPRRKNPPSSRPMPRRLPAPEPEMNVVVVSDIDMLYSAFFACGLAARILTRKSTWQSTTWPSCSTPWTCWQATTALSTCGSRRPVHRTLTKLENWTAASRKKAIEAREEYMNKFEDGRATAQKELDTQVAKIADRTDLDPLQKRQMMETVRINQEKQLETKTEQLKKERDDMIYKSETDLAVEISRVQNQVKWWAVVLPALAAACLGNRRVPQSSCPRTRRCGQEPVALAESASFL